ncbi:F-box domain containing protein [Tanacetum coccineum]
MKVRPGRRTMLLPVQPFHAIDNMVPYDHIDHVIIKDRCSPFGNLEGKRVIFVGTYNGILLLAFKNQFPGHMMLYNPFTEESEMVPDPPLCDHMFTYNYGLGYATTLDELKIFVFRHMRSYNRVGLLNGVDTCCHVFSFKDRSWSIISLWVWDDEEYELWDDQYKYDFIHDAGTFMNGFLYWPVIKYGFGTLLLALDLRYMRFSEIKFPPKHGLRNKKKKKLTSSFLFPSIILGTLDGCLCIVCSNSSKLEVWVSKTHGFVESWEKRYTSTLVSRGNYLYKFEPFSSLNDGKIVMLKRPNQVMILDILNDSNKEANTVTILSEISGTQAIEYTETYLSPYDIFSSLEDNEQDT